MDKLPKGWELIELSSLCEFENGDRGKNYPSKSSFVDSGVPFINAGNLSNNKVDTINLNYISEAHYNKLSNGKLKYGDIVFCLRGSLGKFAVVDRELKGAIASSLVIVRPKENLDLSFLSAYFQSSISKKYIDLYDNGSAQPNLSAASLRKFKIPLPPLPEQKRIVSKLDALFERIDQSIALLEENIKHTEALMASALDEVFGEGSIPIKDVCEINPKKSEVRNLVDVSIEVSFLPMAELNEFRSDFNASQTKEISEVYKGYTYFKESDVLLAKVTPCFENGKAGISRNLKNGIGFGSSEFHVIRPNEKILPEWIYYSVLTQKFRDAGVLAFTGSSGLKRVPAKFVQNWKISLPPINEQKQIISRINEAISKLTKVKSTYMGTMDYYKTLKESILDKAFKGEL